MQTLKISLCVYKKNPNRPNSSYYARMRSDGRTVDIALHTKDRAIAESWVSLRRDEIRRYNNYVLVGERPPADLLQHLPLSQQKQPQKTRLTVLECCDSWERDLRRRGFSERTVVMYCKSVSYVVKDMCQPITSLTAETVRRQMTEHDQLRCSTRRSYFVAYREFLRYCVKHYGLSMEAVEEVPKIRQVRSDRPYWTMQQAASIINHVSCNSKTVEDCYKAWFWFLLTTGARQGEAAAVEWSDIVDGVVTFRASTTKGHKERRVPIEWRVLDMINKLPHVSKLVFANLAPSQAGRFAVLSRAVRKAGVPWGGLHSFRHSASMYLYAHTSDIKATADMLGHSATTAIQFYQASRQADELRHVIDSAFSDEMLIPDAMDRLIEDGLI